MPSPLSGKAGSVVAPTDPTEAQEADKADPGQVESIKAKQRETKSGKYGSVQVKPFQPGEVPAGGGGGGGAGGGGGSGSPGGGTSKAEEKKKSWIEIQMVGEDKKPITGLKYRVTLPDATVAEGTLDAQGGARIEGFEPGACKITFPDLDQDAWEDA